MLISLALAAHLVTWKNLSQIGIAMEQGPSEHLILLVPSDGCSAGMKVYSGHYGDFDKAIEFLKHSDICQKVEDKANKINAK